MLRFQEKQLALGITLEFFYKPGGPLDVGISYRSGINMSVNNGQVAFSVPGGLAANFPNGTLSASLPLPAVTTLGLNVHPTEALNVVLDVNYWMENIRYTCI